MVQSLPGGVAQGVGPVLQKKKKILGGQRGMIYQD
jgi:hypothetical protein